MITIYLVVAASTCPIAAAPTVIAALTATIVPAIAAIIAIAFAAAVVALFAFVRIVIRLIAAFITLRPRFILARFIVGDYAEIMVGKLQIILGQNPVAIVLRVLRKFLVLVEELRRIAACAAVNPIELIAPAALVVAITATAATIIGVITIVIQRKFILIPWLWRVFMVRLPASGPRV
jgi:hypothetical protein